MALKVAYGAGHYRYTAGKRFPAELDPDETREWIVNDQVARAFARAATAYDGIELLRVDDPDGEHYVELEDRCAAANNWGADFFLSIHHDSAGKVFTGKDKHGNEVGGGISCFVVANGGQAEKYQHAIYDAVIEAGGLRGNRSQPCRTANFYVLRRTDAPAILIECGFMDSRVDAPIILTQEYSDKVGYGIMEGIAKMAGLQKAAPRPKPVEHMYRVRKSWDDPASQIGAYRVLDNAKDACKPGYSVYDENGFCVFHPQRSHEVLEGETLWGIAQDFLDDGNRYAEIMVVNGLRSDTIYKGQILWIPDK